MKKVLYLATLLLCMTFTACEKEEIGHTAAESLAGEWYVQANVVLADGTVKEDPYGLGQFKIMTYSTSANSGSEIWIDDSGNFWDFKIKVSSDAVSQTFNAQGAQNVKYDCTVNVDGRILPGAGKQKNGSVSDYITMDVEFSDEPGTIYRLEGVRYSGLVEND